MHRSLPLAMLVAFALAVTPAAAADYTWTGATNNSATGDDGNWAGGVAPTGDVGTVTFPGLGPGCNACYAVRFQDLRFDNGGLSASAVRVPGEGYYFSGPLSVGSGGISTSSDTSVARGSWFGGPVTLSADQSWSVADTSATDEGPSLALGDVNGGSHQLQISLTDARLELDGDTEVGPVSISGSGRVDARVLNGFDGSPVTLSGVTLQNNPTGAMNTVDQLGPLTLRSAGLDLGSIIAVSGSVSLDSGTTTHLDLSDHSFIAATGHIDLAGALVLNTFQPGAYHVPPYCTAHSDENFLIASSGDGITGSFANVPPSDNPTVITAGCGLDASISYGTNWVGGTLMRDMTLAAGRGSLITDQPTTLTAEVQANPAIPIGTIAFEVRHRGYWTTLSGCATRSITDVYGQHQATCRAGIPSSGKQVGLRAVFTPSPGSSHAAANASFQLVVGKASTKVNVRGVIRTRGRGYRRRATATYTATVRPRYRGAIVPTGRLAFHEGGRLIAGCHGRPLTRSGSVSGAKCTVDRLSVGRHTITVTYQGDAAFLGSRSASTTFRTPASFHGR